MEPSLLDTTDIQATSLYTERWCADMARMPLAAAMRSVSGAVKIYVWLRADRSCTKPSQTLSVHKTKRAPARTCGAPAAGCSQAFSGLSLGIPLPPWPGARDGAGVDSVAAAAASKPLTDAAPAARGLAAALTEPPPVLAAAACPTAAL